MTLALEGARFGFHRMHDSKPVIGWLQLAWQKAKEIGVYAVYMSLSYFVMLIVMTFNVGLFISIVFGHCVGIVLFPRKSAHRLAQGDGQEPSYDQTSLQEPINACH